MLISLEDFKKYHEFIGDFSGKDFCYSIYKQYGDSIEPEELRAFFKHAYEKETENKKFFENLMRPPYYKKEEKKNG